MRGTFELMPNVDPTKTNRLYVAGASGSGKSYFCASYIRNHKALFPKSKFYLVTNKAEDAVLDALQPISITPEQAGQIRDLDPLAGGIVLFDDVDSFPKAERDLVMQFYTHVLKDGRSRGMTVLLTSHTASNYQATREALVNSSHLVFFPQSNRGYHLNQFLKLYGDLSPAQIKEVFSWNTRWCVLSREVPRFLLGEHNLKLL